MELIKLTLPESLVTEVSGEVVDFASFLDIPYNIQSEDDHIYIANAYDRRSMYLTSCATRTSDDVWISPGRFYELLQDILSGMSAIEAFNKQGYTF